MSTTRSSKDLHVLDLLWNRRERGQRGPKPGPSIAAIVEIAIRVADGEGLDAVSMARVAKELGFTTMSLYRYVTSKEELLQLMWNGSAQGVEELSLDGSDWRARLRGWAVIQREMIDRHPWFTQMPTAAPPLAPNSLTFVELGLRSLDGTGLADADKLRVIGLLLLVHAQRGAHGHDASRAAARAAAGTGTITQPWTIEALLRRLVDEQDYPVLHRIAWSGDNAAGFAEHEEFLFGVDCILDGTQVLIDKARGGPAA